MQLWSTKNPLASATDCLAEQTVSLPFSVLVGIWSIWFRRWTSLADDQVGLRKSRKDPGSIRLVCVHLRVKAEDNEG